MRLSLLKAAHAILFGAANRKFGVGSGRLVCTRRLLFDLALPFHHDPTADTFRYGAKRVVMLQSFLYTDTLSLGNFQSVAERDLGENHLAFHFLNLSLRLHLELIGSRADPTRFYCTCDGSSHAASNGRSDVVERGGQGLVGLELEKLCNSAVDPHSNYVREAF